MPDTKSFDVFHWRFASVPKETTALLSTFLSGVGKTIWAMSNHLKVGRKPIVTAFQGNLPQVFSQTIKKTSVLDHLKFELQWKGLQSAYTKSILPSQERTAIVNLMELSLP